MDWEKERIHLQETILSSDFDFNEMALKIFQLQYKFNAVYRMYLDKLHIDPKNIIEPDAIPFLPIQFFKYQLIQTGTYQPEKVFYSSGTTGIQRSSHGIRSLFWYKKVAMHCFEYAFYPSTVNSREHLAFLPSYMDNDASSLLFMIQSFIDEGGGGFYHEEISKLIEVLTQNNSGGQPVLWGVSYALHQWPATLDLAGKVQIFETGGMKGRGKEMTRSELHDQIKANFGVHEVFSEYGMTEMLSQAYASSNGHFRLPPTLKVMPRSITDPLSMESIAQIAALNMIDLANLDSCCFIATEDIGKVYSNGDFEVVGRLDNSDIRGCNLLIS